MRIFVAVRHRVWCSTTRTPSTTRPTGLVVVHDVGPDDIGRRWFGRPPEQPPRRGGHLVVATVEGR